MLEPGQQHLELGMSSPFQSPSCSKPSRHWEAGGRLTLSASPGSLAHGTASAAPALASPFPSCNDPAAAAAASQRRQAMASTIGHDEGRREDDKGAVRQEKLQVEYITIPSLIAFSTMRY